MDKIDGLIKGAFFIMVVGGFSICAVGLAERCNILEQQIKCLNVEVEFIYDEVSSQEEKIISIEKYHEILLEQLRESTIMQTKIIKEIDDKLVAKMENFTDYVIETLGKIYATMIERTN